MDRRHALKRMGLLVGSAAAAPLTTGWLTGCQAGPDWTPATLSAEQSELVAHLGELIIPATDTPGARAAQVERFVDNLLTEILPPRVRQAFVDGLVDVEARAEAAHGAAFGDLTADQQVALLDTLADEADVIEQQRFEKDEPVRPYSMLNQPTGPDEPAPFFRMLKEATLLGYYTSEIGATQELIHRQVPGYYDGDVAYPGELVGRTWAV